MYLLLQISHFYALFAFRSVVKTLVNVLKTVVCFSFNLSSIYILSVDYMHGWTVSNAGDCTERQEDFFKILIYIRLNNY